MIDKASDLSSGGDAGLDSVSNLLPSESSNKKDESSDEKENPKKSKSKNKLSSLSNSKKLLILKIVIFTVLPFLFLIIIIFAIIPDVMLSLTDGDNSGAVTLPPTSMLSISRIESSLVYVGDNRLTNLKGVLNKNEINFITAENAGYNWFTETGNTELSAYTSADTEKFIVIGLGLKDLSNIDLYINAYDMLNRNYKNVKFYFMSVNPVEEDKLTEGDITNSKIEEFNSKVSEAFSSYFIDVYKEIKDNFETTDGINYTDATNLKIHDIVTKYIQARSYIQFLDSYPTVADSKTLQISLITAIGQTGIDNISQFISSQMEMGGKCSGAGAAGAATGLVYGLHQTGYHLPYYYGGKYNGIINNSWGAKTAGSQPTPKGNVYYYSGLDCSGFVSWAMNSAGVKGGTNAEGFMSYGSNTTFERAVPGDLLAKKEHVIMIIENKGTYLQCAESTSSGLQFTTMTKAQVNKSNYKIIDMKEYYLNNCES